MKIKRILCSIMAAAMLVGATACSNNQAPSGSQASQSSTAASGSESSAAPIDSKYSAPGVMPIVNEKVTLTVFAPSDDQNNDRADNVQVKELEEMTNIHLEWKTSPSDTVKEKINLMFASGDTTDIVFTGVGQASRLDMATEALLGSQGQIIPLNQYLDSVSVGYKSAFDQLDGMRDYITAPDGNIYSLPNVDGSLHVQYNMKLWINTVWLDNLGLKMPTTTDEFYEVMKAFKEQDANGNGDANDEIPLSTCKEGAGTQIDGFLMNAFQLTPEDSRLYLDNGVVTFSPVQDNYREGLRYLNKMYSEGLINPESFVQDRQNQVNVNENGEVPVIGAFLAQRPGYANDLTVMPNSKKWEQYQVLNPLKGPNGEAVAAWNPYVMYQTGMAFITNTCKEPEAAFRLIDYLATEEGTMRSSFGIYGEHYTDAAPGELGLNGEQAKIKMISDINLSKENITLNQLAGLVRTPYITEFMVTNPNPYADDVTPLTGRQIVMYRASKEYEKVRQPLESVLPSLFMKPEEIEEMALLKTTVMDYCKESIIRFVTGDLSIEKDWDTYINTLNSVGLNEYLQLLQNAYDNSSFAK